MVASGQSAPGYRRTGHAEPQPRRAGTSRSVRAAAPSPQTLSASRAASTGTSGSRRQATPGYACGAIKRRGLFAGMKRRDVSMASLEATSRGLDRGRHAPFPRDAPAARARWRGHATHILRTALLADGYSDSEVQVDRFTLGQWPSKRREQDARLLVRTGTWPQLVHASAREMKGVGPHRAGPVSGFRYGIIRTTLLRAVPL